MLMALALMLAGCGDATAPEVGNSADSTATVPATPADPTPDAVSTSASPLTAATAAATPVTAQAESLDAFWTRFRTAALAGDAAGIRALSAPTVLQRGELDDSPTVRLPAARVPAVVARILATPNGADAAGRTHRAMLQATAAPTPSADDPDDVFRFGDLVFQRVKAGWRLTELYLEE